MWIRIGNGNEMVNLDNISYIEAMVNKVEFKNSNNETVALIFSTMGNDTKYIMSKIAHGLNTGEKLLILK